MDDFGPTKLDLRKGGAARCEANFTGYQLSLPGWELQDRNAFHFIATNFLTERVFVVCPGSSVINETVSRLKSQSNITCFDTLQASD